MIDDKKLQQELDGLKARFMSLSTLEEEDAFRKEMEKFTAGKSPEERKVLAGLFMAGADEACRNTDQLYDETLRLVLDGIYESVSWSYIAKHYFGKSRSWLSQRVNGLKIHNKEVQFSTEEKNTLMRALIDLSEKFKNTALVIEHL